MFGGTFILECLLALILIQLLQASNASYNPQCNPSACGRIPNISYPFRLRGDPIHCGLPSYELVCDSNNNTASLYLNSGYYDRNSDKYHDLNSHKYHVQAINYNNFTIRLVDAALKNDSCSCPQYSLFGYSFNNYLYTTYNEKLGKHVEWPITFVSCPYPLNSSAFLETACCSNKVYASNDSSTQRYTYVKAGHLSLTDVRNMCSIDLMTMTSWPFKDANNLSLSEIHDSLLHGFELSFSILYYPERRRSLKDIVNWCKESFTPLSCNIRKASAVHLTFQNTLDTS